MLNILGDVFLDKEYGIDIELENFIFNLEYPLSSEGIPAKNKVNLCQHEAYFLETFGGMPVAVDLANNHIMDYGEEAFIQTIKYLDEEGVKYFGAGNVDNNFNNPCLIKLTKNTIALLGYCCPTTNPIFGGAMHSGCAILDTEKVIEDINIIKEEVDYVVVQLHWGDEEISFPKPSDVIVARKLIEAGANLIIGHHAHVIQSHEIYNEKHIFYGLGNFIFPDLDVPAYHNGKVFQSRFLKKQRNKNQLSLVVDVDEGFDVTHRIIRFDGVKVKEHNVRLPKWIPKSSFQYKLCRNVSVKIGTIQRFVESPRVPSIEQVKIFLGLKT